MTGYGFYTPGTAPPAAPGGNTTVAAGTPPNYAAIAQAVAGQIPLPGVAIGVAPRNIGLTGLNAWFWVQGLPAGGAFTASRTALGATVNVAAVPLSYVWNFGDGTQPLSTTSPGVAYPGPDGPAAIHHMYQTMTPPGVGYTLSLTFVLGVSYNVNGGAPTALGTQQRTVSIDYPVEEIVSSISSRGNG